MHNSRISLLLIVTLGTVLVVNGQRGSPISSYFGRGSPSPPTQGLGYPQQSQAYSPYGKKPGKSTGPNLIGWLGSQMAKFPSFTRSARPSNPFPQQKYKQQIHGGGGGGKLPVIFSSSSSKYGGSSVNSIHGGGGDVSHIYMPPGSTTPSASMTPQNTIFQIISADGSSRYQASPPPGYENFFSGQQPGGSSPQQSQFSRSPPTPPQRPSLPVHSMDQVVQQQGQFGQVVYHSAGQQPLYGAKAAGNIELIPSKMVSYEKQVLSTGHPEYQASLDGMVTSASNGYPVYYQQQQQQQQQQQVQQQVQYTHPSLPGNYEYRGQQVQRIDENLGSMLNGVSPDIAPIYDLSSLHGQEQQQQQQVAPSHQEPIYVQPPQQQQYASPDNQDMQADYSHQSAAMSVVQPPSNFQYQGVQQQSQQDLQVAESNNQQQQVQIVNHGAADGNPTFEVFADANAPTYDGGHPFDINQLISMIEPGAQVDPKDIVSEDQENAASNNPAYAASQQQEFLPQYGIPPTSHLKANKLSNYSGRKDELKFQKPSNFSPAPSNFPPRRSPPSLVTRPPSSLAFPPTSPLTTPPPPSMNNELRNKANILKQLQTRPKYNNDNKRTDKTTNVTTTTQNAPNIKFPNDDDKDLYYYHDFTTIPTDSDGTKLRTTSSSSSSSTNLSSRPHYSRPTTRRRKLNIVTSPSPTLDNDSDNNNNNNHHQNYIYSRPLSSIISGSGGYPVNPLLDSVLSTDNESEGKLNGGGDNDQEESRQVYQYAITVTPPTHMFEQELTDKEKRRKFNKSRNSTAITDIVSMSVLNSTSIISTSGHITTSSPKRFPVYERQKSSLSA